MKKIQSNSHLANPWYITWVSAATLVYVLTLFIQLMTYDKEARTIAGHDYVREVTRWPGHVRVLNIPVEYTQTSKCIAINAYISLKIGFMWFESTIENKHSYLKLMFPCQMQ